MKNGGKWSWAGLSGIWWELNEEGGCMGVGEVINCCWWVGEEFGGGGGEPVAENGEVGDGVCLTALFDPGVDSLTGGWVGFIILGMGWGTWA